MLQSGIDFSGYLAELKGLLDNLPLDQVRKAADILFDCYQSDHTLFALGNGGSAALASHLVTDFAKGTHFPGPSELAEVRRLKAIAITDNMPLVTAWANDTRYEDVFMRQLENFLRPGDVVLAISGSGNSPNVLKALEFARSAGATTIGFGGFEGGKMKALLDCPVIARSNNMQQIEDAHVILGHMIFLDLKARIAELAAATPQPS